MDPLTQGVIGVVAAQQVAKRQVLVVASVLGALSGMAPDLDVLISSNTDPLLALEYHRHVTHSLFFIPFGGLICALVFSIIFRRWIDSAGLNFKQVLIFCTLGYATHGFLDSCTTYGTQLLWPFSDIRVAWNTISIIDPLYTLPLLFLVTLAIVKRKKLILSKQLSLCALCWVLAYTALGIIQRERVETAARQIAEARGHTPISVEAKPSFANILLWKVVYRTESRYYVDAVRASWQVTHYKGSSIAQLNVSRDFPWLDKNSQQARDVERFRWFSNDYLAVSPRFPHRIIDMRYSFIPNQVKGMWGIELTPGEDSDQHVRYVADRERDGNTFKILWNMILGRLQDTSG